MGTVSLFLHYGPLVVGLWLATRYFRRHPKVCTVYAISLIVAYAPGLVIKLLQNYMSDPQNDVSQQTKQLVLVYYWHASRVAAAVAAALVMVAVFGWRQPPSERDNANQAETENG